MKNLAFLLLILNLFCCKAVVKDMDNTSSSMANKAEGWVSLFDGVSLDQWHLYGQTGPVSGWTAVDGTLHHDPSNGEEEDLVSDGIYEDFELMLQWKIQACGNSGIFWNVVEDKEKYSKGYLTGPEMQILDNTCHPDAKFPTHRSGDLYDMIESSVENVKPAGQWNSVKIRSYKGSMELWQNDVKVVSFEMHTPAWDAMVAKSKFKNMPDFGKARKGHIVLQDHTDRVWFKDIKIRAL